MAEGARVHPPKVTEAELVADIAETVSLHGYKVTKHGVTVDHEKEETRLSISMLKGNPEQTVLKLEKGGKSEKPGGAEED